MITIDKCTIGRSIHFSSLGVLYKLYFLGFEAHLGQGKSKIRESIINDVLNNLLFNKQEEDDLLPLILCRHPQTITMFVDFIYQIVDSRVNQKKDIIKVSTLPCFCVCFHSSALQVEILRIGFCQKKTPWIFDPTGTGAGI